MAKKKTSKKKVAKKTTKKKAAKKKVAKKTTKKKATKKNSKSAKTSGNAEVKGLKVGQSVPKGKFAATSGSEVDLNSIKAVVYFYPKDNTPGCTLEGQDFSSMYKKFKNKGYEVFGVSPDSLKSHEKFKEKFSFPFELISDEDKKIAQAFGVWIEKSMYGRKYMGVDRSTYVIDSGKIKNMWRKVKVKGHVEEVLEAL